MVCNPRLTPASFARLTVLELIDLIVCFIALGIVRETFFPPIYTDTPFAPIHRDTRGKKKRSAQREEARAATRAQNW